MEIKIQKSIIPIYLLGIVWLIYGLLFPLYRIVDFLIVIAVSLIVFFISGKLIPGKKISVEKLPLLNKTSDPKVNEMINEANMYISQIRKANVAIIDQKISAKISKIEELTKKIFDFVIENQDQISSIRRFINYYLPTTIKLLNSYDELDDQGVQGENIDGTMKKIDDMLDTIAQAFEKQLDYLFANDALDISADITVLESIMTQEGLIEKNISETKK